MTLQGDLYTAIEEGNLSKVKEISREKVDVYYMYPNPLNVAIGGGQLEMVNCLLKNFNFGDTFHNNSSLRSAVIDARTEIVKLLIGKGMYFPVSDHEAMISAAIHGRSEIIKFFIEEGFNPSVNFLQNIFYQSKFRNKTSTIKYVLQNF